MDNVLNAQDFHVAADLLVGYPGIYLGGFQIRMTQKTALEVNHKKLRELLKRMDGMDTSITLREALQMEIGNGKKISADVGALVTNGAWLSKMLRNLRKPSGIRSAFIQIYFFFFLKLPLRTTTSRRTAPTTITPMMIRWKPTCA